jgi:hypothetical protein
MPSPSYGENNVKAMVPLRVERGIDGAPSFRERRSNALTLVPAAPMHIPAKLRLLSFACNLLVMLASFELCGHNSKRVSHSHVRRTRMLERESRFFLLQACRFL